MKRYVACLVILFLTAFVAVPSVNAEHVEVTPAVKTIWENAKAAHIRQDYAEALKGFNILADQGYALAQYNLGGMYERGQGVTLSLDKAAELYKMAADKGALLAQYNTGIMYSYGWGVSLDYRMAYLYFSIAAAKGFPAAKRSRTIVAKEMTSQQITEAEQMIREWMAKHKPH